MMAPSAEGDAIYCFVFFFTVPALQQTIPTGGLAVCPNNTVEFTCVAEIELQWQDLNTSQPVLYSSTNSQINPELMTGVFRTVLTDISGSTLTSTATIDSVSLSDDGRNISCRDSTGLSSRQIATINLEGQYCEVHAVAAEIQCTFMCTHMVTSIMMVVRTCIPFVLRYSTTN